MQRLGKNMGGYFGETLDIRAVLENLKETRQKAGWSCELFHKVGDLEMFALRKGSATAKRRIYISTGIHGDEPAGPLAVLQLLQENVWPEEFEYWICPCLNPTGFFLNSRENEGRVDLNRDYRHFETTEITAHVRWLERQPAFDAAFCLHEDWESHGFYLYELNPDQQPSLADTMIAAVSPACPIDLSDIIEGREAKGGIIRPMLDPASRPLWPEAIWLLLNKCRLVYTLEAPSDFPLTGRIAATKAAVTAALKQLI